MTLELDFGIGHFADALDARARGCNVPIAEGQIDDNKRQSSGCSYRSQPPFTMPAMKQSPVHLAG